MNREKKQDRYLLEWIQMGTRRSDDVSGSGWTDELTTTDNVCFSFGIDTKEESP